MGVFDIGDPAAEGRVDRVFEDAGTVGDWLDLGSQQFHPEDIEALAFDIFFSHVNGAVHVKEGSSSGCGHSVLAGSRFRYDFFLAHPLGQQDLAQGIVNLVGAGVVEVLPLEVNLSTANVVGQALSKVEGGLAADIVFQQVS